MWKYIKWINKRMNYQLLNQEAWKWTFIIFMFVLFWTPDIVKRLKSSKEKTNKVPKKELKTLEKDCIVLAKSILDFVVYHMEKQTPVYKTPVGVSQMEKKHFFDIKLKTDLDNIYNKLTSYGIEDLELDILYRSHLELDEINQVGNKLAEIGKGIFEEKSRGQKPTYIDRIRKVKYNTRQSIEVINKCYGILIGEANKLPYNKELANKYRSELDEDFNKLFRIGEVSGNKKLLGALENAKNRFDGVLWMAGQVIPDFDMQKHGSSEKMSRDEYNEQTKIFVDFFEKEKKLILKICK